MMKTMRYLYGPVPSRRLGRSLGIDLVPNKYCTYDCIYCQLGRTTNKTVERKEYIPVAAVMSELELFFAGADRPNYICIAGSGEPTLNSGIGELIRGIRQISDVPVAVLTNGSLLWLPEVREELMAADLVLPSLDAPTNQLFQYVNRPHAEISFEKMVDGLVDFTRQFSREVWLEVFLLGGVTGIIPEVEKLAAIAKRIGAANIQLNTIARPPAESYALQVPPERMRAFSELFPGQVEIIDSGIHEEPHGRADFPAAEQNILALINRRPCTVLDVAQGLDLHINQVVKHLDALIKAGQASTKLLAGQIYYASTGVTAAQIKDRTPEA